jgi:hypothetical protein
VIEAPRRSPFIQTLVDYQVAEKLQNEPMAHLMGISRAYWEALKGGHKPMTPRTARRIRRRLWHVPAIRWAVQGYLGEWIEQDDLDPVNATAKEIA